jgi:hypothetical protein
MQKGEVHSHEKDPRMTIPKFPGFKLIGLEDKDALAELLALHSAEVCEINLGNIMIWRHFDHSKFTTINGNLCILCEPPSEPAYFLQPLGENKIPETIETCLSFAPRLSRIPESFAGRFCGGWRCELDRNNFDYVYLTKDLIDLRGKRYDGKRNRIRKFERGHAHRYQKLSSDHLDGCQLLFEKWLASKASTEGSFLNVSRHVIEEALAHFLELGLAGGVIEVDGRIGAFSIGEKLSSDTAVIHIEIVDPEYEGLPQLINREFVRNEWAKFRFINREQDLGSPGLRRAKLSYHPHHLVKKYNIWGPG